MTGLLDSQATNTGLTATLALWSGMEERHKEAQKERMRWELAGRLFSEIKYNVYYTIRLREEIIELGDGIQECRLLVDMAHVNIQRPIVFSMVEYTDMPTKRVMESAIGELKYRVKMWWKRIFRK